MSKLASFVEKLKLVARMCSESCKMLRSWRPLLSVQRQTWSAKLEPRGATIHAHCLDGPEMQIRFLAEAKVSDSSHKLAPFEGLSNGEAFPPAHPSIVLCLMLGPVFPQHEETY